MKAITEDFLRVELRNTQPEVYYIPEGKILTPAAREYLQQRKSKVAAGGHAGGSRPRGRPGRPAGPSRRDVRPEPPKPKYVDYETGAYYMEKPEHMTQLFGNVLVAKDHPRIHFRGKLDSLQALVVLDQVQIAEGGCQKLVDDLGNILGRSPGDDALRRAGRGVQERDHHWSHPRELRERSHNPQKFFGVQYMQLPDYTMGRDYALLNQLRAAVRETEVAATEAFRVGNKYTRKDIIEELNRLSSAIHIMMCMYLAGQYR